MASPRNRVKEATRQSESNLGLGHGDANRARQRGRELAQRLLRDLEKRLFGNGERKATRISK